MKSFNILNRHVNVHQHRVLQASAGTGKTFSIENMVVRLLVEEPPEGGEPLTLSQILVVTFTRAATRELKKRVRANIEKAATLLQGDSEAPDHLLAIREKGDQEVAEAQRRLQNALASYDEAQIFTIHGFCARMLRECHEGNWTSSRQNDEQGLSKVLLLQIIKDFFRTGLISSKCSPAQVGKLLKHFKGDADKLQDSLAKTILRNIPIDPVPDFIHHLHAFRKTMKGLKENHHWCPDKIVLDFQTTAHCYNQFKDKKPLEYLQPIERFAALFGQETWSSEDLEDLIYHDIILAKLPVSKNALKKPWPAVHYPELMDVLGDQLVPLIDTASSPTHIFAWMAHECQELVEGFLEQEELGGSDQLLHRMSQAVEDSHFCRTVATRYRFAIVDEFQDTDPTQWKILQKLFQGDFGNYLALIGDPKQSIYGFRSADINTYFEAVDSLSEEHHASLDTNFRSCPELVEGINILFGPQYSPGLMPKGFQPVQPDSKAKETPPKDGKGATHFFLVSSEQGRSKGWPPRTLETQTIIPYIGQEILSLISHGYSYSKIAILVKDRYQAQRVLDGLTEVNIPAILERSGQVTDSPAFDAMAELLYAVLRPRDTSAWMQLLGGILLRFTKDEALQWMQDPDSLSQMYALQDILKQRGMASLTEEFLHSHLGNRSHTVLEEMLRHKDGLDLYRDIRHLSDLLAQSQQSKHTPASGLIEELRKLRQLATDEEGRGKIRDDARRNAVRILTIHVSKGLEFPVVFALGLINQAKIDSMLVPSERECRRLIVADDNEDPNVRRHYSESDQEKIRQAYVAMTRAKERLYVPVLINVSDKGEVAIGEASPLELLLARLGQSLAEDEAEISKRISQFNGHSLTEFLETHVAPHIISYQHITHPFPINSKAPKPSPEKLYPPKPIKVVTKPLRIHSFTGLSFSIDDDNSHTVALATPHDYQAALKNRHTLPAGSQTGILLHQILQNVPLHDMEAHSIHQELAGSALSANGWESVVTTLMQSVVHTPLPFDQEWMPLSDVSPNHLYKEIEFLFALDDPAFVGLAPDSQGFVKGVIDLVFTHNNKYYLVDWKSNWLGLSDDHYSHSYLEAAMVHGKYHLQATIYAEALRRYVALFDQRPFQECFGGLYYLFLRGMDPTNPTQGVYTYHPEISS